MTVSQAAEVVAHAITHHDVHQIWLDIGVGADDWEGALCQGFALWSQYIHSADFGDEPYFRDDWQYVEAASVWMALILNITDRNYCGPTARELQLEDISAMAREGMTGSVVDVLGRASKPGVRAYCRAVRKGYGVPTGVGEDFFATVSRDVAAAIGSWFADIEFIPKVSPIPSEQVLA
jgi:hypothetical protein